MANSLNFLLLKHSDRLGLHTVTDLSKSHAHISWCWQDMESLSTLLAHCEGNLLVTSGLPSPRGSNEELLFSLLWTWRSCNRQVAGYLTHWGWVTHICISKSTIIGSDNGLSPCRRQAIIWTNAGILLIRTSGTNLSEIFSEIHIFSFKKMHLKMSSGKWLSFCLDLNELKCHDAMTRTNINHMASPGHNELTIYWWLSARLQ